MIVSFCEGRARLRHPALKNPKTAAGLIARLNDCPGIVEISSNLVTGSVLVLYDPALVSREDLARAVASCEQLETAPVHSRRSGWLHALACAVPKKYETGLLNVSLAFCLLGLLGSRRLHYLAGGVFVVLTGLHVIRRGYGKRSNL